MTGKLSYRLLNLLNHPSQFPFKWAYLHVSYRAWLRLLLKHLLGNLGTHLRYLSAEVLRLLPDSYTQLQLVLAASLLSPYLFELMINLLDFHSEVFLVLLNDPLNIVLVLGQLLERLLLC